MKGFVRSLSVTVSLLFSAVPMFAQSLERVPDHQYLIVQGASGLECRAATKEENAAMRPASSALHTIYPAKGQTRLKSGLGITLLSTDQLEGFPAAKAAFQAAAAIWESRIGNAVNVTIRVDFGPTRFGTPYPSPNILGSTNDAGYYIDYPQLRPALVARADNAAESTLYNSLPPVSGVPTDLGTATKLIGSYAQLKTLGFSLSEDPDDLPSIGFNSSFSFDLDASNGINNGQYDFEAVAVHEMGHALGFGSAVGYRELDPSTTLAPYIWDLFRFRPGITSGTFQSAQRPQSSGGTHVSFINGSTLNMSTGRPDGTGGDEQQSSHWKDNTGGNSYIGLMDPTIPDGFHGTLTQNDLNAFDTMGYTIVNGSPGGSAPAAPTNLTATATSSTAIHLAWQDNSNNETEFRVEQKTGASFTDLGAASANATGINVTALNPGQTATFRVRARNASGDSAYTNEATATTPTGGGTSCTPNATAVCLASNRFRVSINYINPFSNPPNQPGTFLAARLNDTAGINPDTALFGFASAQAVEVVVRIQDTRPFAPRFDVYYGGMTDVGYTVTVTDTQTGVVRTYNNPVGKVGGGVDRTSFPASALGTPDRVITSGGHDWFPDNSLRSATPVTHAAVAKMRTAQQLTIDPVATAMNATAAPKANVGGGSACSEAEPNQTTVDADPLTLGTPCSGTAAYSDSYNYSVPFDPPAEDGRVHDVFKITTTTAGPLTVTLNFTNGAADLDVFLFRSDLNIIDGSTGTTTTETFTTDSLPAGTYYVGVSAYDGSSSYTVTASQPGGNPGGGCTPNATTVCLLSNRFRVSIGYINPFSNPPNQPGTFLAARLLSTPSANPDTGLFGFASAQAVEVVVRVQDTRPFASRFDIYYGGMTDVEYTITVTDTQTGTVRTYHNNAGKVGGGVDRNSFPAN